MPLPVQKRQHDQGLQHQLHPLAGRDSPASVASVSVASIASLDLPIVPGNSPISSGPQDNTVAHALLQQFGHEHESAYAPAVAADTGQEEELQVKMKEDEGVTVDTNLSLPPMAMATAMSQRASAALNTSVDTGGSTTANTSADAGFGAVGLRAIVTTTDAHADAACA